MQQNEQWDPILAVLATWNWFKISMWASASSFASWLGSSNAGMWMGVLVAAIGCYANVHFKNQDEKRKKELHQAKLRRIATADPSTLSLDREDEDE